MAEIFYLMEKLRKKKNRYIALRAGDVTMKKEVCISDKEIKKR